MKKKIITKKTLQKLDQRMQLIEEIRAEIIQLLHANMSPKMKMP